MAGLRFETRPNEKLVPVISDVLLVTGEKARLSKSLADFNEQEIAEWLGSDRVWQYQNMTGPRLDELVQQHGIHYHRRQLIEEFIIVQNDDTPADIGNIEKSIREQFENAGPAVEFGSGHGKGWTMEIPGQGRVVVAWRAGSLTGTQSCSPEVLAATSEGKSMLMIGFHGHPNGAIRKLYLCLPKIMNSRSLACLESNSQTLWIHSDGSTLVDQLKWVDRKPIENEAMTGAWFYPAEQDNFLEINKSFDFDDLKRKFQDGGNDVSGRLHVQIGFADEFIPVKILSFDETEYSVEVVPESPSELRPELKKGTRVHTALYNLLQDAG